MTLPVADGQIGFGPPGDRATVPVTILPVFIPTGGNPDFPSEFTDPAGPQFLAILLPIAGQGLPDAGGETARPGGSPGFMETARRITALREKFRSLAAGEEAVIAGFSDWYVDDLWVLPSPIVFGSIISTKQVVVSILNTFRYEERTLNSIDISALGVGVSVLNDPSPITLQPQQDLNVTFEAVIEGPPDINDDSAFIFDNVTVSVLTTGLRLILFWYQPQKPMEERLGWFTDIITTRDGLEQRDSLRTTPRQVLRMRIRLEDPDETASLRNILLAFRPFLFGVPIWPEQRQVTNVVAQPATVIPVDTNDVDHRDGGTIMIWEPVTRTFFEREILSFTASGITVTEATTVDITKDAFIIPVRFGYIVTEPSFSDYSVGVRETSFDFEMIDNVDLAFANQAALEAEFPVHPENSIPIFVEGGIMEGTGPQGRSTEMEFVDLDGQIGLRQFVVTHPLQSRLGQANAQFIDLVAVRRYRAFLHWLRGSWASFYTPTFHNDLPPKIDFVLDANTITIANIGLSTQVGIQEPHKSVMLVIPSGEQFFAEISSTAEVDVDTETITLVNPFSSLTDNVVASTAIISWLELVRIEGDTAALIHSWASGEGAMKFTTRTIQQ